MKKFFLILAICLFSASALAAEGPLDWLFTIPDPHPPAERARRGPQPDADRVPPGVPSIVVRGKGDMRPCVNCHQATGSGSPVTANLRGLPAAYFESVMASFRDGTRRGLRSPPMVTIAKELTDREVKQIAAYYASLKPIPWFNVVETTSVTKTFITGDGNRALRPEGGNEPLGLRIVEFASDPAPAANAAGYRFTAYVPPGSIAVGEKLARQGSERNTPCIVCHGEDLKGVGDIPPLAGRSPLYIARQLSLFQLGQRTEAAAAPMIDVAAKLQVNDVIALGAYLGSLDPR